MSGKIEIEGHKGSTFNVYELPEIHNNVMELLEHMNEYSKFELFGIRNKAIYEGTAFTGSYGYYINAERPNRNSLIGDVDIILPISNGEELLRSYLNEERVPFKKIGTQISTVLSPSVNRWIQIDFQFKQYHDNEPSEFAQFSNSLSAEDVFIGLKGVYHKLLLASLTAAWDEKDCFSVAYGLREREGDYKLYVNSLEYIAKSLFLKETDNFNSVTSFAKSAFEFRNFYHFRGLCILISNFLRDEQIFKVLRKFVKKINEKEYPQHQIDVVKTIVEDILKIKLPLKERTNAEN